MSFLAPLAFWAAAIVLPALLLLYFLKLRRRKETVSSTLLWRRAVQDLQVNAPFQKLRKNLLLFLQLLILALGIFALARPIVESSLAAESSIVLLIDRSASMNTVEADGSTRLELAKEQAIRQVKALNRTGSQWFAFFGGADARTRVMVIAFADRARVVSPFTTNTSDLVQLIDEIERSDAGTNLREALELAEAYMTQTVLEQNPESSQATSQLVLISDGAAEDIADFALQTDKIKLIPVGTTSDNAGITALRTQRNYENPDLLSVFVQVGNFTAGSIETDVSLYVDGVLRSVQPITLGPQSQRRVATSAPARKEDAGASSASLSFDLTLKTAAVLEVRLSRSDALSLDNRALSIVEPPKRMRVLLVSAGNFFLEQVVKHLPLESYAYLTPSQYEAAPDAEIETDGQSLYDIVIFDKHTTARLPAGNYLFLRAVPQIEGIAISGSTEDFPMIWWDETHPILRHVALDYVYAAKGLILDLPATAETLVEGPNGPVLARYAADGRQYVLLSFAIEESTWWSKPSFPVFMYNAMNYMGGGGRLVRPGSSRPGDTLRIPLPAGVTEATLKRPDDRVVQLKPDEQGVARYADTRRIGLYTVEPAIENQGRFAVNLENAAESAIQPVRELQIGGRSVAIGQSIDTATPEIWRWFIGAALVLVMLEWYIYNRRVMI